MKDIIFSVLVLVSAPLTAHADIASQDALIKSGDYALAAFYWVLLVAVVSFIMLFTVGLYREIFR